MNERVNHMKKTWKRLGALFLAAAMTLTLLPTAAFAATVTEPTGIPDTTLVSLGDMTATGPAPYTGEGYDNLKDSESGTHYGSTANFDNENDRYVKIELPSEVWLSGLYWMNRGAANGAVTKYAILASADDSNWYPVADNRSGDAWVKTANVWNTAIFDCPVKARYVKVLGVETHERFISCAELRLATPTTAPESRTVSGTVVDVTGNNLEGVTVAIGGRGMVTGSDGAFTISELPKNYKYAVTATKDGYAQYVTSVESGANDVTNLTITLSAPSATVSGTITDDKGVALTGAKVTLVKDDTGYPPVTGTQATTANEGAYDLSVSSLEDGSYKIRVSMDGYGTVIGNGTITVSGGKAITSVTGNDVSLTAIDKENADYKWTFDGGDTPDEDALSHTENVAITYPDGAMKLLWNSGDRAQNLVNINNTNAKNCVIEFDATRSTENSIRFGVALRSHTVGEGNNKTNYWIYVGQDSSAAGNGWGVEAFKTTLTATSSNWWSYSANGPAFKAGETRHFKITIQDETITMTVDGVEVVHITDLYSHGGAQVSAAELNVSGDVGLIWGNSDMDEVGAHSIAVDNLYVSRNDPTNAVTLGSLSDGATGTLKGTYTENGKEKDNLNKVPEGVTVKVTATGTDEGKALGGLTVTKADDTTTTITATSVETGVFTFVMPAYAVTVTGELKDTFVAGLPATEAEGGEYVDDAPKANRDYTVSIKPATREDGTEVTADYQWYRVPATGEPVEVGTNSATYRPVTADVGNTLKVVVTGTGTYTGIQTLTTPTVLEADTEVTGISLSADTLELWLDEKDPNAGTATLTLTVSPSDATDPTIEWSAKNAEGTGTDGYAVVTVSTDADPKQATITATGAGTGTGIVTVTVTSADGETKFTKTCTVTVGAKPTSVTVSTVVEDGEKSQEVTVGDPLLLYSNEDGTEVTYWNGEDWETLTLHTSATLKFDVAPEDHTNGDKITNDRVKGNYDLISRGVPETDGYTFSVVNPGPNNVGEETFIVYYGSEGDADRAEMGRFRIVVLRWLDTAPEIVVKGGGQPRPGATLTVNPDSLEAPVDKVYIYWCYQEGNDVDYLERDENGNPIPNQEYILGPNDIKKEILAYVMAVEDYDANTPEADRCYYTGDVLSYSITVLPGAAPAAPTLTVTHVDGETKGTITITDYKSNESYEINDGTGWKPATVTANGVIENLEAGSYQVRIKGNDLHEAGEVRTVTIRDNTITTPHYAVTVTETPPEGGTAVLSADSVEDGASVTLTVNPAVGYEIGSVKVEGSDEELEGAAGTDGTVYTVTVTANTKFVVTYEKITLTITHDLDGLQCDLPDVHEGKHTVKYGEVEEITLSLTDEAAEQGLVLPDRNGITIVTVKGDVETPFTDFDYANGKITFRNGVTQDLKITASAKKVSYTVTFDLTRLSEGTSAVDAEPNKPYTATLTVPAEYAEDWELPASVTVRVNGQVLTTGYTYDKSTGKVTIESVTGNVVIVASAQRKTTTLTKVTIAIGHQDPDVAATPSDIPHVNDVLSADVTPAGASVDYAWYVGDTKVADTKNYTVGPNDVGKTIKVVVTGKGLFSGTQEATTKAVGAAVKLPTGITLDKYRYSMSVGESFTLKPTIAPTDATNKTITWSVQEVASDNVVTGVVTLSPKSDGSVTVEADKPGTVRITATTANGRTASCILNIERANSYALNYRINGEPATVVVTADGERVGNGGSVEATASVTIQVTPEDPAHKATVVVMAGNTSVSAMKAMDKNEWTFEMPAANTSVGIDVGADVVPVTGVTLDKTTATVAVGETVDLVQTVAPAEATNKNVTWTSSDETVATVGPTGVVTGVAAGTATITVTANGGFTATCEVTVTGAVVTNVPVTGVTLGETSLSLTVGETHTLTYTVAPENATNKHISWSTSDASVATVDGGVVTARGAGTATITVTTEDGEKTATCEVTVSATTTIVPVGGITVTAPGGNTTIQFTEGEAKTVQMTAVVTPENATDKTVTWSSNNVAVATVDSNGLVTILSVGQVTITAASANGVEGSCLLNIEAASVAVTGVSLSKTSDTMRVGQTMTLTPTFTPANPSNTGVTWTSSNNEIASVDVNGQVTAVAEGTATITVTTVDGGHTADCTVTVVAADADIPVTGVTVSYDGGDISLPASGTTQVTLTVEVLPSGATNKTVTWSSDNEAVATVDENGVVTVKTVGTVTITATSAADTSIFGTCTLTIVTVAVTGVSLDKSTLDLAVGEFDTLVATVAPADASNKAVTWESGDTSVATVDATGKVTAVAAGTAVITVKTTDGNFTATCTVNVTAADNPTPVVPVIPSNPSDTITNPDGSTTTTVTDTATGTVTETTEKPDGTVEVVETRKDGTVIETTTDPEGGKVEKVTTPDEDVTITVTDKDGEELAKVSIPAEIPALDEDQKFVDVPDDNWAAEAINNMAALGVVQGKGDQTFDRKSPMKRSELAQVLYNMSNGKSGIASDFADVADGKWYADSVAWAASVGVVNGVGDNSFAPDRVITREELAVMLCRYANLLGMDTTADAAALDGFNDGSSAHGWAADSIAWCVDKGILNGMGNGALAPTATATRDQVAVMLQRFIDLMK